MYRHRGDRHLVSARLHDGFQCICILIVHVDAHRRLLAVGAKAAGRIGDIRLGRRAHHPASQSLQFLLDKRKFFNLVNRALTDHNIRLFLQDGLHQLPDIRTAVLVVRICVDDNVRAIAQCQVNPRKKSLRKPQIPLKVHNVMHAPLQGNALCVVVASVIYDQVLDLVNPVDVARQIVQRDL